MRPRSALFDAQRAAAAEIARRPRLAILAEIGFGKTAATLTGLRDAGALPALVAAPARVVETVWHAEAGEWEHLADLWVAPIVGDAARRARTLATSPDVAVVSYENLVWVSEACDLESRFRAIVFDELSRMKSPGTKRFRRARSRIGGAGIPIRLGLTGSPVPNHLLDLWGEMFAVAGEEPLGACYGEFRDRYFEAIDHYRRVWRLKGMIGRGEHLRHTDVSRRLEREIHDRAAPWCLVPPPDPAAAIPPIRVNEVDVPMPVAVWEKQRCLVEELCVLLDSGVELEALQASTLATKLRQFASGAVYTDKDGKWEEIHGAKIAALEEILDELQGEPLLVFYWFRHEVERIAAMLRRTGRSHARADEPGAIDRWNARGLEVLLAHPQGDAAGINLQAGGHHVAWFALPWPHWQWKQGNGRLARTGQRAPLVHAHALLCGPADRRILATLRRKGADEEALLARLGLADLV